MLEAAIVDVNGGFEAAIIDPSATILQSTMAGWVQTPGPDTTVAGEDTGLGGPPWALAPHSGSIAARFSSGSSETGAGASLTRAIDTQTGYTYDVSLWIANPLQEEGSVNNVFSLTWNGDLLTLSHPNLTEIGVSETYVVASNTEWFQLLLPSFLGTGTQIELVISARNNDWATLVDDVVVQETPEPSTVLLLFTGAAIVGMRRRRAAPQVRGIE